MKKLFGLLTVGLTLIAMVFPLPVSAASGKMYLSPGAKKITKGAIITIGVRENSGSTKINAVQANLSYSASKFDYLGITSSSTFGIDAQSSGGNGSVKIGRGTIKAVSGDHLIASVRFRAKASSGSTVISFASGSGMAGSGGSLSVTTKSGSYSFQKVATSPPPSTPPPSSGSSNNTPPAPSASSSNEDNTPPKIGNITVSNVTRSSAIIHWTTSEPATSEVKYGTDDSYGISASSDKKVTSHQLKLDSPAIQPGTTYHFMIKSVDAAGNAASSDDQTFLTQGAVLVITIVNQKNKPVEGAEVTVNEQSSKTDKSGIATLYNLPAGSQTVKVNYKGKVTSKDVVINKKSSATNPQATTIQIETSSSAVLVLGLLALIGLAGLAWYLYGGKGNGHNDRDDSIASSGDPDKIAKELHASLMDDLKKPAAVTAAKVTPPPVPPKPPTPKPPAPPPPAPPASPPAA